VIRPTQAPVTGGTQDAVEGIAGVRDEGDLLRHAAKARWSLNRLEREYILMVLDGESWHQGRAAEILGVNRRTLYRKLRQYREQGLLPASSPPRDPTGEDEADRRP